MPRVSPWLVGDLLIADTITQNVLSKKPIYHLFVQNLAVFFLAGSGDYKLDKFVAHFLLKQGFVRTVGINIIQKLGCGIFIFRIKFILLQYNILKTRSSYIDRYVLYKHCTFRLSFIIIQNNCNHVLNMFLYFNLNKNST